MIYIFLKHGINKNIIKKILFNNIIYLNLIIIIQAIFINIYFLCFNVISPYVDNDKHFFIGIIFAIYSFIYIFPVALSFLLPHMVIQILSGKSLKICTIIGRETKEIIPKKIISLSDALNIVHTQILQKKDLNFFDNYKKLESEKIIYKNIAIAIIINNKDKEFITYLIQNNFIKNNYINPFILRLS
jgi:hypothetical protein